MPANFRNPYGVFQSTPPRRRRHQFLNIGFQILGFQSTPPRRRRLACFHHIVGVQPVSIHASAQEATRPERLPDPGQGVSIHASAQEATLGIWFYAKVAESFNPRLRAGGDHPCPGPRPCRPCFNPRLRAGGDLRWPARQRRRNEFQSTPPRRRRPSLWMRWICMWAKFQSTPPRRRRRQPKLFGWICQTEFQSTPPRRRRLRSDHIPYDRFAFQSTPPRRRRLSTALRGIPQPRFQSTPPRRRRQPANMPGRRRGGFQSTPPRRRRLKNSDTATT